MKKVIQFTKNIPGLTDHFSSDGNGFHYVSVEGKILELGIQAPPGSRFRLNNKINSLAEKDTLVIGATGVYQLNLTDYYTNITKVYFYFNETQEKSPIIVDLTYEVV